MIKKTLQYVWSLRREFIKYAVIGGSGFVLDIGSLLLFKEIFGWLPVTSVIVSQAFLIIYIFYLNKYWTFRNKELPHKQAMRFLILAIFNYIFSVSVMYLFNQQYGFNYLIVRIFSIACMVSWNFFLYKYWVYKA
jgi:putative flippase GtrA